MYPVSVDKWNWNSLRGRDFEQFFTCCIVLLDLSGRRVRCPCSGGDCACPRSVQFDLGLTRAAESSGKYRNLWALATVEHFILLGDDFLDALFAQVDQFLKLRGVEGLCFRGHLQFQNLA